MATMAALDGLWDYDDPAASEARFRQRIADLTSSVSANDEVRNGRDAQRAEAETQLARAQGLQRHFADAHTTLDAVEPRLSQLPPRVGIRYALERGRVYNSSGEPERARPLFLVAWEKARDAGEDGLAVDAAHMLGIVVSGEESLTWNLHALELAQSSSEPRAQRWQGSLYNNIGWSSFAEGRYTDALAMFERALERRRIDGPEKEIGVARWCIGRTLRALGRTDEALVIQQELITTLPEDGYVSEEVGECLLALGRQDESRPHFRRAADQLGHDSWLVAKEPERLARLRALGGGASSGNIRP